MPFDIDRQLTRIEARQRAVEQVIGSVEDAHSLLRSVYSNPDVPLQTRIKAAVEAIPFELPKLAVSAVIEGKDFAGRLEKAIARSHELDRMNGAKVIEAKPVRSEFDDL
jgi:hypothetical protein